MIYDDYVIETKFKVIYNSADKTMCVYSLYGTMPDHAYEGTLQECLNYLAEDAVNIESLKLSKWYKKENWHDKD